ncbi:SymE family type I addiction module toxin [Flavobacterium sp. HNIBRBA15423]|uniref:SymE family type I addiction module toxin n=1 Tax=Flavobacterium sp. HNIBRBA15423 TaxID=3458683 RepID=UPI004044528D
MIIQIMFFSMRKRKISYLIAKAQFKRSMKPKITISGDWLTTAGFEIGAQVDIKVFKNKMIITPIKNK